MGAFYTNVVIRDRDQQQVADFLRQQGLVAYVSPTVDGWTVVYERDSEEQRERVLQQLAARLSAHFETVALAVLNHDDDVLCYWLYERGTLLDQYNSAPGYFDGRPRAWPAGGDATVLSRVFGMEESAEELATILKARGVRSYLFASDRHAALAAALGVPALSVGFGYKYVSRGDANDLLVGQEIVFTGVEASFADSYGNITVCGPDAAAIASYLTQHNLRAFLSPTVRRCTVVYEQRSEALGQQGLTLLANRLSNELACAAFAVENFENQIFWYKLYVGGLLIDEYSAACNPYKPGDARALCAAFGVGHQVAAVADILAAWCWSVSRYEHTNARHQDLVNALDLPIYSVGVGYQLLSGGNVPRQFSLDDFRQVALE